MNKTISWVGSKSLDLITINEKITSCIKTKHFTNNGINVLNLQKRIHQIFGLDNDKAVLMVCNGAQGLNALVGGMSIYFGRKLRFAVQAFTFPCSVQGALFDSLVLDIDFHMGPDMTELEAYIDEFDGIVVTNCFGCSTDIESYENFAKIHSKILLFDNAAAPYTIYKGKNHLNYGDGSMVSLHHTKPIGFGEGGFISFDKKYLASMEQAICFGYTATDRYNYSTFASNYKMSDIPAIYIDSYLNNLEKIYSHHTKLVTYFISQLDTLNITLFKNYSDYGQSLISTIPVIFPEPISTDIFIKNNIEAKKYYYPLDKTCITGVDLFDRIVCLPINLDVTEADISTYIQIIRSIL